MAMNSLLIMQNLSMPALPRSLLMQITVVAALYFLGAKLGLMLAFEKSNATPIWPPAGIALAFMLLRMEGWRLWPGVWLGAFLVNVVVFTENHAASPFTILLVSAVIASGNTLEAVAGWFMSHRWLARSPVEDVVTGMAKEMAAGRLGVFQFALMALTVASLSALIGPLTVCAAGIASWSDYLLIWRLWWFGDASAIFLFTPVVLAVMRPEKIKVHHTSWVEGALAFSFLTGLCWIIFSGVLGSVGRPFLSILPVIWIAMRMGMRGTVLAIGVLSSFAIYYTTQKIGPMAMTTDLDSLLFLMSFLWTIALTSLTVAGTVTARIQAENTLRERNADLEATMSAIPALVAFAEDRECRTIRGNDLFHELLRIPRDGNLSKSAPTAQFPRNFMVRVNGENVPPSELAMQKAARTGLMVIGQEQELIFADGEVRYIYGNAMPLFDKRHAPRGSVGAYLDITEQKRANAALVKSQGKLEHALAFQSAIMDSMAEGLYAVDTQGLVTFINPAAERLFGWTSAELLGQNMNDYTHHHRPDGTPFPVSSSSAVQVLQKGVILTDQEDYFIHKDGTFFPVIYNAAPLRSGDTITGVVIAFSDVTERNRTSEDLRRNEEILRSITDHSADMIFVKDCKSRLLFMNPAGLKLHGRSWDELIGYTDMECHPDQKEALGFMSEDRSVIESGCTHTVEEVFTCPGGQKIILSTTKTPRLDKDGKVIGIIGVARDITEIKSAQNALHRLNDELEKRVVLRTTALRKANEELSHEMNERQRLEDEVLGIAEKEQRRLGLHLHEELSQQLVGIGFLCKVLSVKLMNEQHPEAKGVGELSVLLQEALEATRDLAKSYYPVELQTGGLITALQSLAERTARLFGVDCEFRSQEALTFCNEDHTAIHLYRIVQEAVTNALKHGNSKRILIECKTVKGHGIIYVTDDGSGFDHTAPTDGMGLHLMRYRAGLVGAELEVKSQPNGCTVICAMKGLRNKVAPKTLR